MKLSVWTSVSYYAFLCCFSVQGLEESLTLSKEMMELSLTSAMLSRLVYEDSTKEGTYHEMNDSNPSHEKSFHSTIISRTLYSDELNQAILATTKYGNCIVAFRGAPLNWKDWNESVNLTRNNVCNRNLLGKQVCCTTRQGFYDAYFQTKYFSRLEQSIRDCARKCPKGLEECVVLTGHDKGGSMATLAAISLSDIIPFVITFGQPPTLEFPCDLIPSKRLYRFINTQETDTIGIVYDPVSMIVKICV
jgi:hypothetical protein